MLKLSFVLAEKINMIGNLYNEFLSANIQTIIILHSILFYDDKPESNISKYMPIIFKKTLMKNIPPPFFNRYALIFG